MESSTIALIAILAGGGLIAVILLIVLMTSGGDPDPTPVSNKPAPVENHVGTRPSGPTEKPLVPLNKFEIEDIDRDIKRIAEREQEARDLSREGYEAQNVEDYDEAQRCWKEAHRILFSMIEEANGVFMRYGEWDGEDRAAKWASRSFRTVGNWSKLMSDILKNLK